MKICMLEGMLSLASLFFALCNFLDNLPCEGFVIGANVRLELPQRGLPDGVPDDADDGVGVQILETAHHNVVEAIAGGQADVSELGLQQLRHHGAVLSRCGPDESR